MAIYHCHVSSYRRSKGATATGGLCYRRGLMSTCSRTGKRYDFRKKSEVAFSEFIPAKNDRTDYTKLSNLRRHYEAVEQAERHCLATLGREIEVALPIELALAEQIELVREFIADIRQQLGLSATYCDFSIHSKTGNPHAHICLGEREQIAPFVFSKKKRRDWDGVEFVRKCRLAWEQKTNLALGRAGVNQSVNASSHSDRGLGILPTFHHGRGHYINESEIRKMNDTIKQHNEQKKLDQHQAQEPERAIHQIQCYDLDNFGHQMEVADCSPETSAERLVMNAKSRGWGNIAFIGNEEAFLRIAFAKALAQGLIVIPQNLEQQRLLIEVGQGVRLDYVPAPNAQSVAQVRERELNGYPDPDEEIIRPTGIPELDALNETLTARNQSAKQAPESKKKSGWRH